MSEEQRKKIGELYAGVSRAREIALEYELANNASEIAISVLLGVILKRIENLFPTIVA